MSLTLANKLDLWSLVLDSVTIDPADLLAAIETEIIKPEPDFRTRVLLCDSYLALQTYWGEDRLRAKASSALAQRVNQLLREDLGERGFPSLERRLMEHTRAENIEAFLRELGRSLTDRCKLEIGGSCALILLKLLDRRTDDIDAVDEVPATIRSNHELLDKLITRYGLRLAHFQSHYLPTGYESRLRYFGQFDRLEVYLVDPLDIFVGKLFSRREKDLDDLRMLKSNFPVEEIVTRLNESAASLLAEPQSRQNAQRNWYILLGNSLPE